MNQSEIREALARYTEQEQYFRTIYEHTGLPVTEERFRQMLKKSGKTVRKSDEYSDEEWFQQTENILVFKHARYSPVSVHTHNFIEISYLLSGSCEEVVQFPSGVSEHLTLKQGDVFVIPPGLRHSVAIFDDSVLINILIRTSILKHTLTGFGVENQTLFQFLLYTLYENEKPNYLLFHTEEDESIAAPVLNMVKESLCPDQYSQQALLFLTGTLFTNLQRTYSEKIQFSQTSSADVRYIPQILNYIQQHYQTVTVKELADYFSVSTSWISRIFHRNMRETISETIQKIRVQRACELLEATNLPIQEIAALVGYQDVTYFIRVFRKYKEITPLQYRKS